MNMNAFVLGVEVKDSVFYDQMTGEENAGYSLVAEVIDLTVPERPKYTFQIQDGFSQITELKDLKQKKKPKEELEQVAAELLQAAQQLEMQTVPFEVFGIRSSKGGFTKVLCRLVQADQ